MKDQHHHSQRKKNSLHQNNLNKMDQEKQECQIMHHNRFKPRKRLLKNFQKLSNRGIHLQQLLRTKTLLQKKWNSEQARRQEKKKTPRTLSALLSNVHHKETLTLRICRKTSTSPVALCQQLNRKSQQPIYQRRKKTQKSSFPECWTACRTVLRILLSLLLNETDFLKL